MRKTYLTILIGMMAAAMASCTSKGDSSSTSGTSMLFCDESFENIMEQEIDVFEYIYKYKVHVLARYGTEAEAIDSLKALTYRTIVIPRELTKDEDKYIRNKNRTPRSSRIAVDAVALIVNPDNKADNLSMAEISGILSGEISSWNQIDPNLPDKEIAVLFDKPGSSMMKYMSDSLLNGKALTSNAYQQGSVSKVVETVRDSKYAIGVIGVSWLTSDLQQYTSIDTIASESQSDQSVDMAGINERIDQSGVKVLGVRRADNPRAFRPYQQYIYDGSYPLTRSIYMITVSPAGSPGGGFYSFVTGVTGQKLIMKTGVLPARMQINVVELM